MTVQPNLKRHADLVDRMASARGIDLEQKALRGDVSIDEITDAVLSCTNCTNPGACKNWLDQTQSTASASPDYCRNTALFDRLSRP